MSLPRRWGHKTFCFRDPRFGETIEAFAFLLAEKYDTVQDVIVASRFIIAESLPLYRKGVNAFRDGP